MHMLKKKAFTLAELLVVVIVLGVLAAVAVPKFTRVLETRKTTEVENIFAAVRTEQENRCVFGKSYSVDKTQLAMLSDADSSSNYTYGLTEQGITAASAKGYALKMLSYKDGEICCEGEYCSSLNKQYPLCSSLTVPTDECASTEAVTVPEPEPEPEPEPAPVYECDINARPITSQFCGTRCGRQSREISCDTSTGQWKTGPWGACEDSSAAECDFPSVDWSGGILCSSGTSWSKILTGKATVPNDFQLKTYSNTIISETVTVDDVERVSATRKPVVSIASLNSNRSGRICNSKCQWENMSCPDDPDGNVEIVDSDDDVEDEIISPGTGSGSSGGGGGGGGDLLVVNPGTDCKAGFGHLTDDLGAVVGSYSTDCSGNISNVFMYQNSLR